MISLESLPRRSGQRDAAEPKIAQRVGDELPFDGLRRIDALLQGAEVAVQRLVLAELGAELGDQREAAIERLAQRRARHDGIHVRDRTPNAVDLGADVLEAAEPVEIGRGHVLGGDERAPLLGEQLAHGGLDVLGFDGRELGQRVRYEQRIRGVGGGHFAHRLTLAWAPQRNPLARPFAGFLPERTGPVRPNCCTLSGQNWQLLEEMRVREFDLLVIGGGSGGLAAAQRAVEYGARVALFEPARLGGTCVNVGCVPKKVMWNAAELAAALQHAPHYGFDLRTGGHDWAKLKRGRDAYVLRLNGIYERNLDKKGIVTVRAAARLRGATEVVDSTGEVYGAKHIVIATGGQPKYPPVPGAAFGHDVGRLLRARATAAARGGCRQRLHRRRAGRGAAGARQRGDDVYPA